MPLPRTLHPSNSAGPATRAYINHGRWIVECECREAHEVSPGQRQWRCMLDISRMPGEPVWVGCGSEYHVVWPSAERRRRIEAVLSTRPRENRNWWPWESIDQLVAENLEHDVAVPEAH